MNQNAYTVVAIEGTHFCNAARIVCLYTHIHTEKERKRKREKIERKIINWISNEKRDILLLFIYSRPLRQSSVMPYR